MKVIHSTKSTRDTFNNHELPENLIVFSHLRWDFVYQRPQHLLTRLAADFNIVFVEEPVADTNEKPFYSYKQREDVVIMTPHISGQLSAEDTKEALKGLFNEYMANKDQSNYAFWYYTPMALEFSRKFTPALVVYDCMDELSDFKFAPAHLKSLEQELLKISDVVFTGGRSLYEAKKHQHANIYPFPSSIDKVHFNSVRQIAGNLQENPAPGKVTLGFYGVIDERFDATLIKEIADARPEWEFVIIGPVVKIDPKSLPDNANIKYLGSKSYQELPQYMAEWDIALIPFLLNESTRFISPTKTPEYLAAGLPVISTGIKDVINPYANNKLVRIGANAGDFIDSAEYYCALSPKEKKAWLNRVDQFLELNSWDKTCSNMLTHIKNAVIQKSQTSFAKIV
jgi:glycosyltransferase involved in cell wall biosynthesis